MTDNQNPNSKPETPENATQPVSTPTQPHVATPHPAGPSPFIPMTPPAQPRAKDSGGFKRGFGTGFGFGTAMIVFGAVMSIISGIFMVGAIAAFTNSASAQTSLDRTMTIWGNEAAAKADTIRAINIAGPIQTSKNDGLILTQSVAGYEVAQTLDTLKAEDAAGVILIINTPGGTITGAKAIADAVKRYQDRTKKKVIAFVTGMSASGGVYSMVGANSIIADYGTMIGSIGVIFGPFDHYKNVVALSGGLITPGVTTTGGITREYLSQGKGKDFGNPFREMTAAERANLMAGLEREYNIFVNWVSSARKIPAAKIKNELGAYIFDAQTAKEKGIIDDIMNKENAFKYAAKQMGLDPSKAGIVTPKPPSTLETLFGAESRVFGTIPAASGSTAKPTSTLCTGTTQVLALQGSFTGICR